MDSSHLSSSDIEDNMSQIIKARIEEQPDMFDTSYTKYNCTKCSKFFSTQYLLGRHINLCNYVESEPDMCGTAHKKIINCSTCSKLFSTKHLLERHNTWCKQKKFHCEKCTDKSYAELNEFQQHMQSCHVEKEFKCPVCLNCFCDQTTLGLHLDRKHKTELESMATENVLTKNYLVQSPSGFKICAKESALAPGVDAENSFLKYLLSPGSKPVCSLCNESFHNDLFLKIHLKQCKANKLTNLSNAQCELETINLEEEEEEIEKDDEQITTNDVEGEPNMCDTTHKKISCTRCSREFKLEMYLEKHLVACKRENKCSTCSKVFSAKSIKKHIRRCTNKNFRCEICADRSFPKQNDLQQHMQRCHAAKEVKCPVCLNYFSDRLERHIKVHEIQCIICYQFFVTPDVLKEHLIDHFGSNSLHTETYAKKLTIEIDEDTQNSVLNKRMTGDTKKDCTVCKTSFCDDISLKTHLQQCNGDEHSKNAQYDLDTIDLEDKEKEIENDDPNNFTETTEGEIDDQITISDVKDSVNIDPSEITMVDIESIKKF